MHFPPVKYLCPAVSGKSTKCAPGHSDERAHFRRKKAAGLPQGITGGACFHPRTTKRTPAALLSSAVQFSCLAPWSRWLLVCILPSRGVPPMADFRPGGLAASVHPCAHSAVRVGFPTPFLLGRHLTVFRPLRYPPHSILGHDSLSGPVSPQSHSYHTRFPRKSQRSAPCKTALYCRTAKNRRSGAESPCFAGKKDV